MQTLLAIVDAQRDYAALDPMKVGLPVYARRLLSSPGRKDGLYWENKPGEPESPLGPLVAKAQAGDIQQYGYYGYHFRLLYSQGPDAPGGAYDYLVKGRMLGGFAIIAWPVRYGETGVMTFIVSRNSDVYEKDLGPDTAGSGGDQRLQSRQVMGQGGHDAVVSHGYQTSMKFRLRRRLSCSAEDPDHRNACQEFRQCRVTQPWPRTNRLSASKQSRHTRLSNT